MNTFSRGIRNAFRNGIRTGSTVMILGLSIGLIIAMLAARQAVNDRISQVKSSVGNTITISPAGIRGFEGGGEPLTTAQMESVAKTAHITKVTSTLSDRLTSDDSTSLQSSITPGTFGRRFQNQENQSTVTPPAGGTTNGGSFGGMRSPRTSITITGTNGDVSTGTLGGSGLTWTSGKAFDPSSDKNEAVVGTSLADKNGLSVGSTFTAYGQTVTVTGIYDAGNNFANNSVYTSLATLQKLSSQPGAVTAAVATVDSADNLSTATAAIKSTLGTAADVTNSQDIADATIKPLESVSQIATFSLIGAVVAGAVITLLTMVMIVRERRREVGVMKAIGSSNFGIMSQFVVEAVTLTVLGLIVGLMIGVVAAAPLTNMLVQNSSVQNTSVATATGASGRGRFGGFGRPGNIRQGLQAIASVKASVGLPMIAAGVGAALIIAILGSAIPSIMISKIKPADAMRSE